MILTVRVVDYFEVAIHFFFFFSYTSSVKVILPLCIYCSYYKNSGIIISKSYKLQSGVHSFFVVLENISKTPHFLSSYGLSKDTGIQKNVFKCLRKSNLCPWRAWLFRQLDSL
jgi:hypothetical protein